MATGGVAQKQGWATQQGLRLNQKLSWFLLGKVGALVFAGWGQGLKDVARVV